MKSLDEIDAVILCELLKDGRKRIVAIAEEYGLSKDVIWNHYSYMKKEGIIVGSTIQYNYQAFGYEGVATLMINVKSQNLKEILEKLGDIPDMLALRQYNSSYNICVISTIKDLKDLDRVKEQIKKRYPITAIKTSVWIDCRNTPENLFLSLIKDEKTREKASQTKSIQKDETVKLDAIDLKIVEDLVENGDKAFKKIGQSIGVSTDTVARRYERLVNNGFIKVSIQINPRLLGYNAMATFLIFSASQSESKQHVETLSKIPDLTYMVKVSGECELQLAFLVKNIGELLEINNRIMELPDIAKIEADIKGIPKFWPGPRQYISTF